MKRAFQSSVFLLCVLASAAGFYNVTSDNAEVEKLAQEVACGEGGLAAPAPQGAAPAGHDGGRPPMPPGPAGCRAQKTMMERTPIAQSFTFATSKRQGVNVRCSRAYVFAGDYACAVR